MRCRLVDADGPLARLKKAIFNPELYENIAEWIVVSVLVFFFFGLLASAKQEMWRVWRWEGGGAQICLHMLLLLV